MAAPPASQTPAPLQRSNCKDSLAVYDCTTWQPRAQFAAGTADLADLAWSPNGGCIAAWESALYGHQLTVFTPEGECLTSYSAYRDLLGIKAVAWSPSGQLLALGDYDQVRPRLSSARHTVVRAKAVPQAGRPSGKGATAGPELLLQHTGRYGAQPRHLEPAGTVFAPACCQRPSQPGGLQRGGGGHGAPHPCSRYRQHEPARQRPLSARLPPRLPPQLPHRLAGQARARGASGACSARRQRVATPCRVSLPVHVPYTSTNVQEPDDEGGELAATKSRYVVAQLPVRVPVVRAALDKPNPKLGVGELLPLQSNPRRAPTRQRPCSQPTQDTSRPLAGSVAWSFDGSYIATRCDSMPGAVWIWETSRLELSALLLQTRVVRAMQWCPTSNRLVVCTGDSKLYLWTPDGASCVHIPLPGFRASGLCWHPDGASLVLTSRNEFCCAYF